MSGALFVESRRQRQVVFTGNSLSNTSDSGGATNRYPAQTMALLGNGFDVVNLAVGGQTTTIMNSQASTRVDPVCSDARLRNIIVPWEITNDLFFGATKEAAYSAYVTYCTNRRARGFKVVAVTVLPRSDPGTPGDFEVSRAYCNSNIVSNWATYADALADVAANTTIGETGDQTNATYYVDLVHMTNAGYGIVAGIVAPAITGIL
jgi:lysophospholipase L1-like esterase